MPPKARPPVLTSGSSTSGSSSSSSSSSSSGNFLSNYGTVNVIWFEYIKGTLDVISSDAPIIELPDSQQYPLKHYLSIDEEDNVVLDFTEKPHLKIIEFQIEKQGYLYHFLLRFDGFCCDFSLALFYHETRRDSPFKIQRA